MQEPQEIVLGTRKKRRGTGRNRKVVEVKVTMVYVPILENLQVLLMNDRVRKEVFSTIIFSSYTKHTQATACPI